jgi:hypothetical protein
MPAGLLDEIRDSLRAGTQMPFVNGITSLGSTATAATAVTANGTALANITVLPEADAITGFDLTYSPDAALTAGVEIVGFTNFTSSISGFGTQAYPFAAMSAALGTAVGNLVQFPVTSLPSWIPTSTGARANWTITPTVALNATIDSSNFLAGAYWR